MSSGNPLVDIGVAAVMLAGGIVLALAVVAAITAVKIGAHADRHQEKRPW